MHFNNFKMCPKVAQKKSCPNMPKWHWLDLGQVHPQVLKTIQKVYTSQISRLTSCDPGLFACFGGHLGGQLEF